MLIVYTHLHDLESPVLDGRWIPLYEAEPRRFDLKSRGDTSDPMDQFITLIVPALAPNAAGAALTDDGDAVPEGGHGSGEEVQLALGAAESRPVEGADEEQPEGAFSQRRLL